MSRRRFLSLFILIASAVSGVLIADYIGAVFAMTVIGMFCCSFLLLPFSLLGLTLSLDNPQDVQRGGNADLQVHLTRKGFCPCGSVKIIFSLQNHFTGHSSKESVIVQPVKGKSTLALPVHAPHAGNTEISVTRIWFYDLTGLLCIPRKVKGAASFCALPQSETARVRSVLPQEAEDSGEADPNRPGHSRPELFGVHEYVPGDPLRDIHWKLSARLDKMMVREYVRPVSRDIGLLLLNGGSGISPAAADKLADAAFSLSLSLVQADIRHTLCWCENGQAKTAPVQSEEDVFAAARAMLSVPLCPSDMLCSFLHSALPPAALRVIFAASEDETVIRSLLPREHDRLFFIGDDVPPLFAERISVCKASPVHSPESPAASAALLLDQGVYA